jgi:MFS transporter, PHS family, inorganic phosphate transporter
LGPDVDHERGVMSGERSSLSADASTIRAEDLHRLDEAEGLQDRGKILATACMGFFTDAYDLFIIGLVLVILKKQWGVTGGIEKLGASSVALLTAAIGSWAFGRLADRFGRKSVYGWEMLVLAAGAIASAFSPNIWWLIGLRGCRAPASAATTRSAPRS